MRRTRIDAAGKRGPITVLVAEEHQEVRLALGALVAADEAFDLVGLAEDTGIALELTRLHKPDVALVDVGLPGRGGAHAAREIHARSARTQVVALSPDQSRASAFGMLIWGGAVDHLVKSASAEEVLTTIARAAGQSEEHHAKESRVGALLADGLLEIEFQPIVALDDGHRVGCEALARFPSPPVQRTEEWFVDAAAVGLQIELELAAVNAALRRLGDLPADTFMTVNVSPAALLSTPIVDEFLRAELHRVVIEITEHAQVDDYDALNTALGVLRKAGARVAIDDAGGGFASLRHVLRLSPDIIKIDRSLTADLESRAGRALVAALISFAGEMGQTVIVEGIESAATAKALADLGVTWGQGFFFGRPGALPSDNPR
jgi:EAL domain-containing protein (putative c-di-GMP-specific phosphodiesterase class I)/CheY-like chemotaxis protein